MSAAAVLHALTSAPPYWTADEQLLDVAGREQALLDVCAECHHQPSAPVALTSQPPTLPTPASAEMMRQPHPAPTAAGAYATEPVPVGLDGLSDLSRVVMIHTGNVRRCNHQLHAKTSTKNECPHALIPLPHRVQITTALKCTMHCWRKYNSGDYVLANDFIGHPKLMDKIKPEERAEKSVTAKLFVLDHYRAGFASDALRSVISTLNLEYIDTLIADPVADGPSSLTSSGMWEDMENLYDAGLVRHLGVANLGVDALRDLEGKSRRRPSVDQLDVRTSGAPASDELRAYAREQSIRLQAHHDAGATLTKEDFQHIMNKVLRGHEAFTPNSTTPTSMTPCSSPPRSPPASMRHPETTLTNSDGDSINVQWQPLWVMRYTVVDTPRAVVENIGYVICGRFAMSS
ncbi:uncharacterized protein MONBRDRAFT_25929 [Monosiga brevicollis MX1]|uniref:GCS light chain n=1 Tax=Monosiga brevicollis TaxID=81824 RepID=A9V0W0_MONBE|nr:uncharacterized protein MONBRDRAFT_25929 [Monosiga brevicollis MX1]EDQ88823.1 predicted protein [Monosiga brevicollis MX1]|eukprot:XP_001746436.1 hypothetical protein [Monosiga brevicollis MX1]